MGLILPPDPGTRPDIIPVPIPPGIMLPRGGLIPIRLITAPIIIAIRRFRSVGTILPDLIPIIVDTSQ